MLRFGLVCGCTGLCHTIESDIFLFLLLLWQIRDTGRCGKHCVENLTNHVLRYRKLLIDGKSGMMKYQTGSDDGIISFLLNGRGKSVHVQDDKKVFVCNTDSKRKKAKYTSQRASQKKYRLWLAWETNHTKRNPQNHESPHQKSCESRNTQTFEGDTRN